MLVLALLNGLVLKLVQLILVTLVWAPPLPKSALLVTLTLVLPLVNFGAKLGGVCYFLPTEAGNSGGDITTNVVSGAANGLTIAPGAVTTSTSAALNLTTAEQVLTQVVQVEVLNLLLVQNSNGTGGTVTINAGSGITNGLVKIGTANTVSIVLWVATLCKLWIFSYYKCITANR